VRASTHPLARDERVGEAITKLNQGAREEAERLLALALRDGSLEAADALDALVVSDAARSDVLVKVRRQAAELCPGDMTRLRALRDAAQRDQNTNYVHALEHCLRAFDPEMPALPPPPMAAQSQQPGMLALLTRHSTEVAGEVFGTVWEGAQELFAKPPTAYQMTGVERIAPGAMSTLSRTYETALRLLDVAHCTLFHRRETGPLSLTVALLQPPAAILRGTVTEDGTELKWLLGHAISSVMAQNLLPLALGAEGREVWEVLRDSFGPVAQPRSSRAYAHLAANLWQTLPPRAQRHLQELLAKDDNTSFDLVLERAKHSGRRVGMFLTGDFAYAARMLLAEHPRLDATLLRRPGGLSQLCSVLPALADLFRLAIRPAYADARWHVPSPQSTRGLPVSERIRIA
jgi:hypothetical protein